MKNPNTEKNLSTAVFTHTPAEVIAAQAYKKLVLHNEMLTSMGLEPMTWIPEWIPFEFIKIEQEYQRQTQMNRVNSLTLNFNPNKLKVKSVNYRDKAFWCFDGAHTMSILKNKGYTGMWCRVFFDMSKEEESLEFADQNDGEVGVSTVDKFNAKLVGKDKQASDIKNVCDEFDLTIVAKATEPKTVSSIRCLTKIYKMGGADALRFTFQLLYDAGWADHPGAFIELYMNIGFYAYPHCQRGDSRYETLRKVMETGLPSQFAGWAKAKFPQPNANHNELSVKQYVLYLLGVK